jgi:Domain of unknown function (DUF5047)
MWPVPAGWNDAMRSGNINVCYKIECLFRGQVVFSSESVFPSSSVQAAAGGGFILSGSVTVDVTSDVRRRCDIEIVDPDNILSPYLGIYGQEIRLYRGMILASGPAHIPIGTFRPTEIDKVAQPALTIKLRGSDRAYAIAQRRLMDTYTILGGTNNGTAIQALIQSRIPWMPLSSDFTTVTTTVVPQDVSYTKNADVWAICLALAGAASCDLYCDPMGTATLLPVAAGLSSDPVWEFVDGQSQTAITAGVRDNSSTARSVCVVTATGTALPSGAPLPTAASYDIDPDSSTYYLGEFGMVPDFFDTPLAGTTAQCQAMADARLTLFAGRAERAELTAIPNPAHEGFDPIHVVTDSGRIDVVNVLENFAMPLSDAALMSCGSRRRLSLR